MASLSGVFNLQVLTSTGVPAVSFRLYTYAQGTTTHKIAYTEPGGTISHAYTSDGIGGLYIALNSRGELPSPLFLAAGPYDLALKTPAGATEWTRYARGQDDTSSALAVSLASTASGQGGHLIGADPGTGATPTTFGIWVKQQVAVAANYPSVQAALNSGAKIVRLQGNTNLTASLTIPAGVTLVGEGMASTSLTCTANTTAISMLNVNDAAAEGILIVANAAQTQPLILMDANGVTIARNRIRDIQGSGSVTDFALIKMVVRGGAFGSWAHTIERVSASGCGTIFIGETQSVNSWINSISMNHVHANDFIRGIQLIAGVGQGVGDSTFLDWAAQTSARTQFGLLITDAATAGYNSRNSLTDVRWYDLINGGGLGWYVGTNALNTVIQGSLVDTPTPGNFRDLGVGTLINGVSPREHFTRGGRVSRPPTSTGLTAAVTGTATTQAVAPFAQLRTGATLGSVARLYSTDVLSGMSQNSIFNIDFTTPFVMTFTVARITSGAAAVGRIQIKTVTTDGALAAKGLGLRIDNYTLVGESYGTTLGVVGLGVTMTDSQAYRIDIAIYAGVRVEWWVNGALRGTTSTASEIPSLSNACYLHASLANVTAVDAQLLLTSIDLRSSNA